MNDLPLSLFGADARFHHLGLAVKSIAGAAGAGAEIVRDDIQRVSVSFVDLAGIRVELIEPSGTESPVSRNLRNGQPLVHLCFEVGNLTHAFETGRGHGFHSLGSPVPAAAFGSRRIAWMFSRTYGVVELLERGERGT